MILIYFDQFCLQGCRTLGFNDCICWIFFYQELPFPTLAPKPAAVNQVPFWNLSLLILAMIFSHVPLAISWKVQFRTCTYGSWCLYKRFICIFTRTHLFLEHILCSSTSCSCTRFELYNNLVCFPVILCGKRMYVSLSHVYYE